MFGTEENPQPPSRRRWLGALVIVAELLFGAVAGALLFVFWLFTTPEGLQRVVDKVFEKAPMTVTLTDVEVLPTSRLFQPDTWTLAVTGVRLESHVPNRPVTTIGRVHLRLPNLRELYEDRVVHFDRGTLIGLRIHAPVQRPGPDWEPQQGAIHAVRVDQLDVWGAYYSAEPDEPLLEAGLDRIVGRLDDVVYDPGTRELTGHGQLTAARFHTGTLEVHQISLPELHANRSDLDFSGTVHFGEATVALVGDIDHFHRKPAVRLEADVRSVRVDECVEAATGQPSPIYGTLDAHLSIFSGGEIPRGKGYMEGTASLRGGVIPLGADVKPIVKDLIRVVPYLKLDKQDRVLLGDMEGRVRLDRGTVEIPELLYHAERRNLHLRGTLTETDLYLVLRLMPKKKPEERPGVGVVMYGSEPVRFRLAKKWELLPSKFERPPDADAIEAGEKRFKLPKIRIKKPNIKVPKIGKIGKIRLFPKKNADTDDSPREEE